MYVLIKAQSSDKPKIATSSQVGNTNYRWSPSIRFSWSIIVYPTKHPIPTPSKLDETTSMSAS